MFTDIIKVTFFSVKTESSNGAESYHFVRKLAIAVSRSFCFSFALELLLLLDCSQSPIFPCDRRDRARLTVNGGHLDF